MDSRRLLGGLALAALATLLVPAPAAADPITYQLQVFGGPVSGSLGGVAFTNANITVTMESDTADVVAFSVSGVNGFENLVGTARIDIFEGGAGGTVLSGTFLPAAGVYVSVDGTNSGIGFGAFGVLPSEPTFPGEPVYPVAEFTSTGAVATYDLASDVSVLGFPVSCVAFATPAQCAAAVPLPTSAGDLLVDFFSAGTGFFTARVHAPVATPFASFTAEAELEGRWHRRLELEGRFTLGAASDGIDPLGEDVTLQLGSFTASIPAGSFRADHKGGFVFAGVVDGARLRVRIDPRRSGGYALDVQGSGPPFAGMTVPLQVVLTVGNDTGSATAAEDD